MKNTSAMSESELRDAVRECHDYLQKTHGTKLTLDDVWRELRRRGFTLSEDEVAKYLSATNVSARHTQGRSGTADAAHLASCHARAASDRARESGDTADHVHAKMPTLKLATHTTPLLRITRKQVTGTMQKLVQARLKSNQTTND
jgi:hypothetical protein